MKDNLVNMYTFIFFNGIKNGSISKDEVKYQVHSLYEAAYVTGYKEGCEKATELAKESIREAFKNV